MRKRERERLLRVAVWNKGNRMRAKILAYLGRHPRADLEEIATAVGCVRQNVVYHMKLLGYRQEVRWVKHG